MIARRFVTKLPLAAKALKLLKYYDSTVIWQESNLHPFLVRAFFDQNLMPSMPYGKKHDIILPFILYCVSVKNIKRLLCPMSK